MKALKVLALAVLMILVAVPFASAQITWTSSFTVVNLGTADATVTVTFYCDTADAGCTLPGGSLVPNPLVPGTYDNPFTLAPGGSAAIVLAFVNNTLPDGVYSVVISADQPIVAIANLAGADGSINYNGSYSGMEDAGQTEMYMPSVNNSFFGWGSNLSIQNLTNAAMDITVEFFAGSPTVIASVTDNVPAYTSWHLPVASVGGVPTDYNGSAVVSAAGPVAVVDNQYNMALAPGANQVYSGAAAGSMDLYCAALYDMFINVWFSSLNVQNIGTTTATVDYMYSDGQTEQHQIGPNAALLLVYNQALHDQAFSVHVQGDQPLVAVANANAGLTSQTYECAAGGSTEIRTPLVMKDFIGMFNTGVQVQNLGAEAQVCIEYEGYESDDTCATVPANGTWIFYTPGEVYLPAGFIGAARVYSTSPLVGVVNQNNDNPGSNTGDFGMTFRMFNTAP